MEAIWKKTTDIIKDGISHHNFETWIKPIRPVRLVDDRIGLGVPNRFFKDWVAENYVTIINDSLNNVCGKPLAIDFEILHEKLSPPVDASVAISVDAMPDRRVRVRSPRVHPTLNPNYGFDRFVVGNSNQFAHAASVAVAEQATKDYNPLFIYGGVGLGKTHLLNAIGLHTLLKNPSANVVFVSAEAFMNELINSIRFDKMQHFREKYRNIDCLLIDDIQFIAGKERTQEEFFHTFNSLHDGGKQIVVTSDKFPKEIPNLEGRLRSRFEWGLIADIQPPEIETKIAIIKKKAQENSIDLPDNAAYYIASHSESNIREMEGFLLRSIAFASLKKKDIDIELVKEVLRYMVRQTADVQISIDDILKIVASKTGVRVSDIKSPKKSKQIALSRQIAMFLARKLTDSSFPDIGERIGDRDHSTVIYACNKMEKILETDSSLRHLIDEIEDKLKHSS